MASDRPGRANCEPNNEKLRKIQGSTTGNKQGIKDININK